MPERIVYILGAGFSAPLGLPVMGNFLIRSKDLFAQDPNRLAHFSKVFDKIDRMHKAKSYYTLDLFNIEEVLSVLEMEDYVSGTRHRAAFVRYLADVIAELTPAPKPSRSLPGNWNDIVFDGGPYRPYTLFVASLFGIDVMTTNATDHLEVVPVESDVSYGVITLNYDLVLETCLDSIHWQCQGGPRLRFVTTTGDPGEGVPLAKLHGSIDPPTIVPPTWQKSAGKEVRDAWRIAQELLANATQIRIIGYSMPETDSYIRYLLASGAISSSHLKAIDVLCLDPDGSVKARYKSFIDFYQWRFAGLNTFDYLNQVRNVSNRRDKVGHFQRVTFTKLEEAHDAFMTMHSEEVK